MTNSSHDSSDPDASPQGSSNKPTVTDRSSGYSFIRSRCDVSISGWIATTLGLYLFATGSINLYRLIAKTDSGPEILGIVPELLGESSPVASDKLSIIVLFSYVAGLPMFAGSALMGIGSLARHTKTQSSRREVETLLNPEEYVIRSKSEGELLSQIEHTLKKRNVIAPTITVSKTLFSKRTVTIRDSRGRLWAQYYRDFLSNDWVVRIRNYT